MRKNLSKYPTLVKQNENKAYRNNLNRIIKNVKNNYYREQINQINQNANDIKKIYILVAEASNESKNNSNKNISS